MTTRSVLVRDGAAGLPFRVRKTAAEAAWDILLFGHSFLLAPLDDRREVDVPREAPNHMPRGADR